MTERIARRYEARFPLLADEIRSAAFLGLVDAVARYTGMQGAKFETYAHARISGQIRDCLREALPKGFRRQKGSGPGLTTFGDRMETESSEGVVGWEVESIDAVNGVTRHLPANHREAILLYFTTAAATFKRVGQEVGLSESETWRVIQEGLALLRGDWRTIKRILGA